MGDDCSPTHPPSATRHDAARGESNQSTDALDDAATDLSTIPQKLNSIFTSSEDFSSLHPTEIVVGDAWYRKRKRSLLLAQSRSALTREDLKGEKDKAYDLLDALSCSGSLSIDSAELHVIVATTYRFDKDILSTVIEDDINPVEKLEGSMLAVGSTIFDVPCADLLKNGIRSERLTLPST